MSIDTGTTSSRIILFDLTGKQICKVQLGHDLITFQDKPGYVEQDAEQIYKNLLILLDNLYQEMKQLNISTNQIISCGVTNQRETIVFWDKNTGKPLRNSIVWQDIRTINQLQEIQNLAQQQNIDILKLSGLPISTFFSSTKIKWVIENDKNIQQAIKENILYIGTMDSFIIYKLTNGKKHLTDITNAQRTQLLDINKLQWSEELCNLFQVPIQCLPEIHSSTYNFGQLQIKQFKGLNITGVAGDQQASLFGHQILSTNNQNNTNICKMTLGTGVFMLQNIGQTLQYATKGFLTTIAYQIENQKVNYAYEGSISCCGTTIEWLIKNKFVQSLQEFDQLIVEFYNEQQNFNKPQTEVVFVPAFQGLFSPYWEPNVKAQISGLSQATTRGEICYAAVEGIIMQINDMISSLGKMKPQIINVDGGLLNCPQFCNLLSEMCQVTIKQKDEKEITALGVAMLSLLGQNYFTSEQELSKSFNLKVITYDYDNNCEYRQQIQKKWQKNIQQLINYQ